MCSKRDRQHPSHAATGCSSACLPLNRPEAAHKRCFPPTLHRSTPTRILVEASPYWYLISCSFHDCRKHLRWPPLSFLQNPDASKFPKGRCSAIIAPLNAAATLLCRWTHLKTEPISSSCAGFCCMSGQVCSRKRRLGTY